ncbi:MAG: Cro/CI family transcriptional regulator [Gallionella sp.]|nr:Cro/CI family transcriptional regulator [Gallionella sp.]
MTPEQVIRHYGGERQAADALQVTRQIVNYWKRKGSIPSKTQAWIHLRTGGLLKAANGKSQ